MRERTKLVTEVCLFVFRALVVCQRKPDSRTN